MTRLCGAWAVLLCWACTAGNAVAPAPAAAPSVSPYAACPGRPRALELEAEGDQTLRVNVSSAIEKYESALRVDPSNHQLLWKLAQAQEKTEDYAAVAETLGRATELAPEHASYWRQRGKALLELARAGQRGAYIPAKHAFATCIEKAPNQAECHALLAEAALWTDDEQRAAQSFTRAIELAPSRAEYYATLADLYATFKHYAEAERVLEEGARLAPPSDANRRGQYRIQLGLFQAATRHGQREKQRAALEEAGKFVAEDDLAAPFVLGTGYLELVPPEPARAKRLLTSFSKRVCKGVAAARFKRQCEISYLLQLRLEP